MERRINKIKLKGDMVIIQWQQYQPLTKNWDNFSMSSKEAPLPSLPEAMTRLAKHVEKICELPERSRDKITVTGISHSYSSNNSYVVITAQKELITSRSPLNLNTPVKAMESDIDDDYGASDERVYDIEQLEQEAFNYIDGQRAQQEFDFGDDEKNETA